MNYIGFVLPNGEEFRYVFNLLSADGVNLNLASFLNVFDLVPMDVEVFIEKGKVNKRVKDN